MTRGRKPKDPIGDRPSWASRIAQARQRSGLSQESAAELLRSSQSTIGAYETGKSEPSLAMFERLAEVYGVAPGWLAFGIGEPDKDDPLAFSILERHKHDKLFAFTFVEAARLFSEEGLHADLSYLATYAFKLLREAKGAHENGRPQDRILALIDAERAEIRQELDAFLKKRL